MIVYKGDGLEKKSTACVSLGPTIEAGRLRKLVDVVILRCKVRRFD